MVLDLSDAETEDRFHTELSLLLGGPVPVQSASAASLQMTEGNWLDALRPVIPEGHAVVWIDPGDTHWRASVAIFNDTRAEVQIVEVPGGDGAEALLALSVREVLASADSEPLPPPAPTPAPPPPTPPEPAPPRHHIRGGATVTSPLDGVLRGGAVVLTTWRPTPTSHLGLRLDIQAGAKGLWLQPGIQGSLGRWFIGTHAAVVRHPWGLMVRPGVRAGATLPIGPSHAPAVSLTWLPVRDIVHDESGVRYDSGFIELTVEYTWGRSGA